jgi:hypothetical protein
LFVCWKNIKNIFRQLKLRKGDGDNYVLYANCNEKCTGHFWFCNAKITLYSMEEGEEMMKIKTIGPIYAFYGNYSMLIGQIDLPKTCSIFLAVEIQLSGAQSK